VNRFEHLMTILGEECAEITQIAAKINRFGLHESRDLGVTNRDRLQAEYNDLVALVEMLNFEDPTMQLFRDPDLVTTKKLKVEHYLEYSETLGTCVECNCDCCSGCLDSFFN
jgi:hypothetical protein